MGRYILGRILVSIPVLIGITIITFALIHLAPGDPVTGMIDPTLGDFNPELVERERAKLGLDQPLPVQYVLWLGRVVQGDLGYSLINRRPVAEMVGERLWGTLQLTISALLVSIVVGTAIGILSAVKQYSLLDYLTTLLSFFAVSIPGFFLSLGLIYIFALKLKWLPTSGMRTLGVEPSLWDKLKHMIMPVTVLSVSIVAPLARYARSSMLEVLGQDYVWTARAKGLREWVVVVRHAFPNALIPLVTVIGLRLPTLFGGSVIVEQIFHWRGMGTLNIWAVLNQDYTVLMGLNMISAILVLLANQLADIAYAIVDPRISYE
ncbi:MAG: ABC transporter permease [Anaerolineae bacterium]|jgi:peptide/nickel transport system permease protein